MAEGKERILVVDGHSIIHAWEELRGMHRGPRRGMARVELVRRLQCYQDETGEPVMVVFDGGGEKVTAEREPEGVKVVYSGGGRTADDVIERVVARHGEGYAIRVATEDRAERETVEAFGGEVIGAEMLKAMVERADREMGERIRRLRG